MIKCCMDPCALAEYVRIHIESVEKAIDALDSQWPHSSVALRMLERTQQELQNMKPYCPKEIRKINQTRDRKTEKYTDWAEVMRLAVFHYQRFSQTKLAKSEGLYASLLAQAITWRRQENCKRILIPGCGPGRSVLDFARAFPNAKVMGLDYSLLALLLGEQIVCGTEEVSLLRRDVRAEDAISQELLIPGFGLKNAEFYLGDLISCELPKADMIVCSNTLNLLPDHSAAVKRICNALELGGLLIFADLIGWRLDRGHRRKLLCSDQSIKHMFESSGLETLDQFNGVPYIESESDDQETIYSEHFYIGCKVSENRK